MSVGWEEERIATESVWDRHRKRRWQLILGPLAPAKWPNESHGIRQWETGSDGETETHFTPASRADSCQSLPGHSSQGLISNPPVPRFWLMQPLRPQSYKRMAPDYPAKKRWSPNLERKLPGSVGKLGTTHESKLNQLTYQGSCKKNLAIPWSIWLIDEVTGSGRSGDLHKFIQLVNGSTQIEIWVCLVKASALSLITICILMILNKTPNQRLEGPHKAKNCGAAAPHVYNLS